MSSFSFVNLLTGTAVFFIGLLCTSFMGIFGLILSVVGVIIAVTPNKNTTISEKSTTDYYGTKFFIQDAPKILKLEPIEIPIDINIAINRYKTSDELIVLDIIKAFEESKEHSIKLALDAQVSIVGDTGCSELWDGNYYQFIDFYASGYKSTNKTKEIILNYILEKPYFKAHRYISKLKEKNYEHFLEMYEKYSSLMEHEDRIHNHFLNINNFLNSYIDSINFSKLNNLLCETQLFDKENHKLYGTEVNAYFAKISCLSKVCNNFIFSSLPIFFEDTEKYCATWNLYTIEPNYCEVMGISSSKPDVSNGEIFDHRQELFTNANYHISRRLYYSDYTKETSNDARLPEDFEYCVSIIDNLFKKESPTNFLQIIDDKKISTCYSKKEHRVLSPIGRLKLDNGFTYDGEINEDDQAHGYGTVSYDERPHEFSGEFRNGQFFNGLGYIKDNDSSKHFGFFINGVKSGSGRCDWNDGKFYDGHWKNGKPHGYGKYGNKSEIKQGLFSEGTLVREIQ